MNAMENTLEDVKMAVMVQNNGPKAVNGGDVRGIKKPRNHEIRRQVLEDLKDVPHADAIVSYFDVPELTIRKIMQLTVFLWTTNLTCAAPVWLSPDTISFLTSPLVGVSDATANCSGLALMLFACRKGAPRNPAWESSLGKMSIALTTQVIMGIFQKCRNDLFRTVSTTAPFVTQPKYGRRNIDPPRYLTSEFIRDVAHNEYTFVQSKVDLLCRSARTSFDFEPQNTKKRRKLNKHGLPVVTVGEGTNDFRRPLDPIDHEDLTSRAHVLRYLTKTLREGLNAHRSKIRTSLYKQLFFVLRTIQARHPVNPQETTTGYYITWPETTTTDDVPDMNDPNSWPDIPLAHKPEENPKAAKDNEALFTDMMLNFPNMNCFAHFRRFVRTPSRNDRNYARYSADLTLHRDKLYIDEKLEINFHSIALSLMACFLLEPTDKATAPVLALSPLSLRAIHIWAMAIRALTIRIAGGPTITRVEEVAAKGISVGDELGDDDLAFIMLGASDTRTSGTGNAEKRKFRQAIDRSITTCSYSEYIEKCAELRTEEIANNTAANETPITATATATRSSILNDGEDDSDHQTTSTPTVQENPRTVVSHISMEALMG